MSFEAKFYLPKDQLEDLEEAKNLQQTKLSWYENTNIFES